VDGVKERFQKASPTVFQSRLARSVAKRMDADSRCELSSKFAHIVCAAATAYQAKAPTFDR